MLSSFQQTLNILSCIRLQGQYLVLDLPVDLFDVMRHMYRLEELVASAIKNDEKLKHPHHLALRCAVKG